MRLTLHEHPFASYCWKVLIALYEREVPCERHFVGDQPDRERLAELWPLASIPVLVDDGAGLVLPESTPIIEYLDRFGEAPPLVPADPDAALRARLWDRICDGQVMTPLQKIVGDSLRPEGRGDAEGVAQARGQLDQAYALLNEHLGAGAFDDTPVWSSRQSLPWAAGSAFTLADCAAAPSLFYARIVQRWDEERLADLTRYFGAVTARPAVARVIEEAREYRHLFPLPWPDYAA